ncbi:hypothetical protein [Prosthecobacter sp.]|uniref:hypothetical protein n=1 Tax=Prosthecobacter sp. TaxID=1965333 RepID=UPI0037833A75
MHRYKIHFTRGGSAFKDADRCNLDGALVCLYKGDSLAAVFPRRIVSRIEEQAGSEAGKGDPMLSWMSVLTQTPA